MKDTASIEILNAGRGSGLPPDGGRENSRWPLPLVLAVGLHALVLVVAVFSPSWFTKSRKVDVVSIDLVNIGPPSAAPPGPPAAGPPSPPAPKASAPAPPPPTPAPPPREAPAPIPEPPPKPEVEAKQPPPPPVEAEKPPPTPAAPREVISIAPDKAKKVVKKDTKVEEKNLSSAIAAIQKKIEADRAEKAADEKAKRAVDLLRERLLASGQAPPAKDTPAPPAAQSGQGGASATTGGGGGSSGTPTLLGQYYAQLIGHLRQFYQLPPGQSFEPGLKAIITITIAKDGKLKDISFEKKSGNVYFDRFVERAFKSASPVPPLPPALNVEELGPLGINCYPNELI